MNVVLITLLAIRLAGIPAGIIAGVITACYPFFAFFANLVLADTLAIGVCSLIVFLFVRIERLHHAFYAGLALGLGLLTKASLALLPVFFLPAFYVLRHDLSRRRRLLFSGLVIMGYLISVSPWWIRNAVVFHRFVPFSSMGGFTFYESNAPSADGGPNHGKTAFPPEWQRVMEKLRDCPPLPEAAQLELEADRILRQRTLQWILDHPLDFFTLMPRKFLRTWNVVPNWSGANRWYMKIATAFSYIPVLILAGVALLLSKGQAGRRCYLYCLIPAFYLAGVHSVFMGSIRYRLPAMGPLIALAGVGGVLLLTRLPCRWRERLPRFLMLGPEPPVNEPSDKGTC
ncbi:MAG: hypothetical protein D6820_14935 [Lentisphaerae bacterium]|nr:MAG: hypothetical protein D6820_14935 [Lentisphaerota bacterium]